MSSSKPPQENHRRHTRLALSLPGQLELSDEVWNVWIRDVSLKGALVEQKDYHESDSFFESRINCAGHLRILTDPEHKTLLEWDVRVIHGHENMIGVAWPTIDLDNLTILREILVANLANEELIERELTELLIQD